MKIFETENHAPDSTIIPFLDSPELTRSQKDRLWRQLIRGAPLPFLTKWILFRSLRSKSNLF